jgi:hypothetical protein
VETAWVLLGLVAVAVAYFAGYWSGTQRAHQADVRQLISNRRTADGRPDRSEPSEREWLEAKGQLSTPTLDNAYRLSYLWWRDRAYERLTPEQREEINKLNSEWPGTPDALQRREAAVFEILRLAGGDPPRPSHRT